MTYVLNDLNDQYPCVDDVTVKPLTIDTIEEYVTNVIAEYDTGHLKRQ